MDTANALRQLKKQQQKLPVRSPFLSKRHHPVQYRRGRQRLDFMMQIYGKKNEKSGIAIELFFHFCYNRNIYAAVVIL